MLSRKIFLAGLLVTLAVSVAVAQDGVAARLAMMGDDAGITTGQPIVVVEKILISRRLADGTTITRYGETQKWRDSQGRFRKQSAEVDQKGEPVFHSASIIDPVNNTLTTIDLDKKTATVFHLPDHGLDKLHTYVDLEDKPLVARPGVDVKVEKLQEKTIAGVPAVGRRVTRIRPPGTVGNDKTVVSVSERWVSPDLHILLATSMDDPREKESREVTQLDRAEPDEGIFRVPADFTVKDVPVRQSASGQ